MALAVTATSPDSTDLAAVAVQLEHTPSPLATQQAKGAHPPF
jgi:hypothetical protein